MGAYLAAPKTEKVSVNESLGDISYGASCMQGWRVTMEDAHCCLLDFDEKASLFGVYDGHGGSEVAEYVAKHLSKEILSTENYKKGCLKQSLIEAFLKIDQKIISEEGMSELKELAGMNDVSEADEDETELLSKEAEMPLEQLLSKLKQQGYEAVGRPVDMIQEDDSEEEAEEDSDDYSDEEDEEGEGTEEVGEGGEDGEEQATKQEQNGEVTSPATDINENGKEATQGQKDSINKSETNDTRKDENEKENTIDAKNTDEGNTDSATENQQKEDNKESEGKEDIEDGEIAGVQEVDDEEDEGNDDEDDEPVMPHSDEVGYDSGTTAIVALLKDKKLVVANVGDSRCVLCRSGVALDMSLDHKPDDDKELNRIENAGGKVTCEGRVNGGLNLSRALGDHSYKLKSDLAPEEQMISAFPDVRETTITESDEFIVIACDGIWNVMSSQEVVDFVADRLKKQRIKGQTDLKVICEELFDACLAPDTTGDGSGCDNMTCVIVLLKPQQTSSTDTVRTGKRKGDETENCEDNEQCSKRVKSDD